MTKDEVFWDERKAVYERTIETQYGSFHYVAEHGAWENEDGTLAAPALTDGDFDENDIAEVTVPYDEA